MQYSLQLYPLSHVTEQEHPKEVSKFNLQSHLRVTLSLLSILRGFWAWGFIVSICACQIFRKLLVSCGLQPPRPATGVSRALRARGVSGSVPESVPENRGFSGSVPRSVSGARRHSRDTFWTLRSPGPEDTPVFGDTLGDTPGDTSGPKNPRDPCSRPGGSQPVGQLSPESGPHPPTPQALKVAFPP